MKSLLKLIIPIVSVGALIIAIYSWHLEDQRNMRINESIELSKAVINKLNMDTISNIDSLKNEIINLKFEKETYTNHLELMSNWFILFETVLFGIFFIVGYGVFDNKITDSQKENKTAYKKINKRYVQFEKEFIDLKDVLYNTTGHMHVLAGLTLNPKDTPAVLMHQVRAAYSLSLKQKDSTFFVISLLNGGAFTIKKVEEGFDSFKNDNMFLHNLGETKQDLTQLIKHNNEEIRNISVNIFSRIDELAKRLAAEKHNVGWCP